MLRPVPIGHYMQTVETLGFDARDVLAGTNISSASLEDPRYLIDLDQYRRVFENMARVRDGLGLDIGLNMQVGDAGPLVHAAFFSTTARQSLEDYWPHFGEMFGLICRPFFSPDSGGNTTLEVVTPVLSESAYRLCIDEALAMLSNIGGVVVGQKPEFERIEFSFAKPDYSGRYTELFRCPIVFGAKRTRFMINPDWLEKPIRTRDEQLSHVYQHHLRKFLEQVTNDTPIVSRIRDLFLHRNELALPALSDVATELGISERTVARQLQHAGVRYRALVEEFRMKHAVSLLESEKLSTKQIAYRLGFQDVNAFRRAFKSWTGQTFGTYQSSH